MAGALNTSENMITERELNNSCDASLHAYDSEKNDPFGSESHGTARYVGVSNNAGDTSGTNQMMGVVGTLGNKFDFQTMKAANNQKSTRSELPRSELIKMLVYLEGELQARDVVIAALRNERVKHLITQLRCNPIQHNDPLAAMFRDKIALGGNLISRQSSTAAVQAEMEVRVVIEQQMESLYQMVHKQRATHVRMVSILTDSLDNNQRMLQELEEEKRKHEHDTAQGDDITYGLEMERTKLRQELETERAQTKKLEKDVKKLQETLEFERGRQKQIVLLLIAERKKILMKYIEEGKRSEDLAQILSEEKQRSDSIAEGLEEESKKSLRMEAEIEKQTITFENERKNLRLTLAKEEKRIKELEAELNQLKNENETLKKTNILPIRIQAIQNVPVPIIPAKSRPLGDESCGTPSSLVNIAKIVQPTATVSSVPVSGPTTGIARSISPGQNLRAANILTSDQSLSSSSHGISTPPAKVVQSQQQGTACSVLGVSPTVTHRAPPQPLSSSSLSSASVAVAIPSSQQSQPQIQQQLSSSLSSQQQQQPLSVTSPIISSSSSTSSASSSSSPSAAAAAASSASLPSSAATASSPASALSASSASNILPPGASVQLQLNPSLVGGGTLNNVNVTASNASNVVVPSANISNIIASVTVTPMPLATTAIVGTRGIPPPIPPNKPVVPPKREPSISRIGGSSSSSLAANNK